MKMLDNPKAHKAYHIAKKCLPYLLLFSFILLVFSGSLYAAEGVDYLEGAKGDVAKTFGEDSSFIYFAYIAEVLIGGVAFIKTKSPWTLVGIVILMIFTHFFLGSSLALD
ncbi:hypothetical protein L3V86_08605 [Thiotrichales bacterium 19S11-10]|nr:hypothetical protein [Thiotrichales bacterium 19S11-10]